MKILKITYRTYFQRFLSYIKIGWPIYFVTICAFLISIILCVVEEDIQHIYIPIIIYPLFFLPAIIKTIYYVVEVSVDEYTVRISYMKFNKICILNESIDKLDLFFDESTFGSLSGIHFRKKISKYDSKKILTQYCYLDWAKKENINALKKMIEDAQSHKE